RIATPITGGASISSPTYMPGWTPTCLQGWMQGWTPTYMPGWTSTCLQGWTPTSQCKIATLDTHLCQLGHPIWLPGWTPTSQCKIGQASWTHTLLNTFFLQSGTALLKCVQSNQVYSVWHVRAHS